MIKILADASCDLSAEGAARHGIRLMPTYISFGTEQIRSDQISAQEVIERTAAERRLPVMRELRQSDWAQAYTEALSEADEVISLHLPPALSRSHETALAAAQPFGDKVLVLNGNIGSYALGLQALRAVELAERGLSASEIHADLQEMQGGQFTQFMVETPDHLKMSGQAGGVSALLGNMLGYKPLLKFEGGEVVAAGRARGRTGALLQLAEALSEYAGQRRGQSALRLAYLYSPGGEEGARELQSLLGGWGYQDGGLHPVGPVMTAAAGPGAVGLVGSFVRPLPRGHTPGHTHQLA